MLWVIYIDPLLTELNQSTTHPYNFNHHSLSLYNQSSHSQLTFMDDSTLIAASKTGLETLLSITNHKKYVLVSTQHKVKELVVFFINSSFPLPVDSITINTTSHNISFRYLGVWFNMKDSPSYVVKQLAYEYRSFTNLL